MKRKFLIFIIAFLMCIINVNAASIVYFEVSSEEDLVACLNKDNMCKLTSDITLTSDKIVSNQVVLDLNGHVIEPDPTLTLNSGLLFVGRGGKLTIDDSVGTGKITSGNNIYAAIQMINKNDTGDLIAELVVNAGTLEGKYYGITGNGTRDGSRVTINGGKIKTIESDSVAIFEPQTGDVIINDGLIEGGTGIEIRAGNLTVNGGTIKGVSAFTREPNGSGTTTTGVGVTVAQHTTKKPINVKINDGNISGQYAFYEWNPQNNDEAALNKISLSINGGDFRTTLEDGLAVYSQDFRGFIHNGNFNSNVSEYLASSTTAKLINETSNSKNTTMPFVFLILVISSIVIYKIYKKKAI